MIKWLFRLFRTLFVLGFIGAIFLTVAALYYMEYELPDIDALNTVQLQVPLQIFTQDNKLLATFGEKRRIPIPYNEIPTPLVHAVLATEDQRYFQHSGVDLPGLGRAALRILHTGRTVEGGSTITMQVARSFYLSRHKTLGRKLREILLAIKIEHRLTKEKILELYLNKVFLGNRAYGVGAAAEIYYGKHLNELTIDQYAMLAGLPQAPSALNPIANPEAAKKRRDHVLSRMLEQGYIDNATYNKAIAAPLDASYHDLQTEVKAPYVAELVRQQLEQMYGESIYTDGFKVKTTVDSNLQTIANQSVHDQLLQYDQRHGYRGAEANVGAPDPTNLQSIQDMLKKKPTVNGLEPVVVAEMSDQSITVMRADGNMVTIPWAGLAWARKQINADYLGGMPHRANQIVQLGDVVRIMRVNNGYQLAQLPKAEAGIVALNPQNGGILAMVGGFDYRSSNFNRITSAERQPGSSFKPFIYSAALEKGYTLATVINDAPIIIENPSDNSIWRPQNDTRKFYGPTRLRTAIMQSRNLVSIRLLALMGLNYTFDYLKRFGFISSQLPQGLSLALGTALVTPLQMAQAYAVFANGGSRIVPYAIDSIHNSQNEVIYKARPQVACDPNCDKLQAAAPRVISAQNAFLITSALQDVIQHGTASEARVLKRSDLAGKTGTTQNQVDAWFAGYNPDLVTISWMGFDAPQSLHEYGAKAALPLWMQFMQAALQNRPIHNPAVPEGIVRIAIDPMTGKRADAGNPLAISEYFMEPYVPSDDQQPGTPVASQDPAADEPAAADQPAADATTPTPDTKPATPDAPAPDAVQEDTAPNPADAHLDAGPDTPGPENND